MQVLLVAGIVVLVLGLVLVFGLYPYIDSQATQEITNGLNANMTSKLLDVNSSISVPYNANGKGIFIFYYNSSYPLEVQGAPENDSSVSSAGTYYVIPNGSGEITLIDNWSHPVSVKYSSTYYFVKNGGILGVLILAGIPLIIIGAFMTIFGFIRRRQR
ncbi:hypothetical protein [Metallosphaera hakonensis]|uniref:Uncharacterized protein n=1 Tax=Metallosphaera hakonensis JCM 8857 = DSM 7519 TaxID=1293036 RepID=A0A2U9ISK4_9CREN|nr:hypothetical protein [Metallosphaera hakonensis]AWR99006.1 hypothetical protein DFR87_04095 [Metallosphaera hakonensis JCM 8857 = DSM 7519]